MQSIKSETVTAREQIPAPETKFPEKTFSPLVDLQLKHLFGITDAPIVPDKRSSQKAAVGTAQEEIPFDPEITALSTQNGEIISVSRATGNRYGGTFIMPGTILSLRGDFSDLMMFGDFDTTKTYVGDGSQTKLANVSVLLSDPNVNSSRRAQLGLYRVSADRIDVHIPDDILSSVPSLTQGSSGSFAPVNLQVASNEISGFLVFYAPSPALPRMSLPSGGVGSDRSIDFFTEKDSEQGKLFGGRISQVKGFHTDGVTPISQQNPARPGETLSFFFNADTRVMENGIFALELYNIHSPQRTKGYTRWLEEKIGGKLLTNPEQISPGIYRMEYRLPADMGALTLIKDPNNEGSSFLTVLPYVGLNNVDGRQAGARADAFILPFKP